ncbi:MAG: transporter, partial [Cyanobacteria bacterium RYN_339]|nr:transporter [Cyanobacteria bacterium RYN_339]
RALPDPGGTASRLDFVSMALNGAAFAALVVGAETLPARPALAAVLFAAAVLGFAVLVRRERSSKSPLLPLDLLRGAAFRVSVIASLCCFAGQAAGMVALPFYLQHGLGQTALMTGLYITPWPLTVALAAPITSRLANYVPTAWLCAAGGACLAAGLAAVSLWPVHGDPRPLVPFIMLCGLGFGLFQVPNNRNLFLAAPRERSGAAGGMQGTARLMGQTAGGVVLTLLFALTTAAAAPRVGLGIGAVLALVAGVVSLGRGHRLRGVA